MSPRHDRDRNFLYGGQGQGHKRSKYSFWPSKSGTGKYTDHFSKAVMARPDDPIDRRDASTETSASCTRTRSTPAGSSRHQNSRNKNITRRDSSEAAETDCVPEGHPSENHSPSLTRAPTLYPFDKLASTVKQCPWMLGPDTHATRTAHSIGSDSSYYPPVPRSLLHDTAISLVVTDHTHPAQPRFVISCPLEHVDLVPRLLAPDGSRRVLRARGSSGHPREGAQLRSMLLDGTPNIELALQHADSAHGGSSSPTTGGAGRGRGAGGWGGGGGDGGGGGSPATGGTGCGRGSGNWGGGSQAGRYGGMAAGGSPAGIDHDRTNRGCGCPPAEASGGPPRFVPMAWVPGVPMPPPPRPPPQRQHTGWCDGPSLEDSEMPYDSPTRANA